MQSKFLVESEKKNCKPYPPLNPKKMATYHDTRHFKSSWFNHGSLDDKKNSMETIAM
jgi:hypothetical protein